MNNSLLHTLLELGDATSRNLGFAYSDTATSYGEETITETNLLEIRRRHPNHVRVFSFSKQKESHITGADWEWHFIGRKLTLKLRVQAKRVTKAGAIAKLDGQASKAPLPQIDLLIQSAQRDQMKPLYCFYCAEQHRSFWTAKVSPRGYTAYETGCLIADALEIRNKTNLPKRLEDIEQDTVPWHYLCAGGTYGYSLNPYEVRFVEPPVQRLLLEVRRVGPPEEPDYPDSPISSRFPTTDDLNRPDRRVFDREGVHESDPGEFERDVEPGELEERGIGRLVLIDVREPDWMAAKFQAQR